MTVVIAPPPVAVDQLSDLISLIKNVDQAEKLVKDLKAATKDYHKTLKEAAEANSEIFNQSENLRKQEHTIDTKHAKFAKQKTEAEEALAAANQAQSELGIASAAHDEKVAAFDKFVAEKKAEFAAVEANLTEALSVAIADKAEAAQIKAALQEKMKAVKAAVGA